MRNRKALLATATAALVAPVLLTGCAQVNTGVVSEKAHQEAYTTTSMVCSSYASNGSCTVYVPIIDDHPECWQITLSDTENSSKHCIDKGKWDTLREGDHYTVEDGS